VRSRELREATEKVMGANATAKQYPCVGALRSWRGPCVQVTGSFSLLFWLTAATYTSCGVLWNMCMKGEKLYPQTMPTAPGAFSDSFYANRTSRGLARGRQRRALERGTTPTRSWCRCSPQYRLHSC
jgi:hypothetical protein